MAKILGTTTFNGNVSKMVELTDEFIINGQVYDKSSLSPNSLEFLPVYSSASNEMFLSQTTYVNSDWYRNQTTNGLLVDNNDPNICYVATQGVFRGTGTPSLHKISRTPNGLVDTINSEWGNGYGEFLDLISQDSKKIYYTINRAYSNGYSYIGSFDKTTMTQVNLNINSGIIKVLKESDMFIYIATPSVNVNCINIGKYNKITNTITWILADSQATGYYSDSYVSDMNSNGVFYAMKDGFGLGLSDHFIVYRKYVLDTTKDVVNTSVVNVDISLLPNGKLFFSSGSSMGISNTLFNYTDSVTGKKYINHLIYNRGVKALTLNAVDSGLYTYEIIDDDNWKLVSYTLFNPIIYKAFLPVYNNQLLCLAHENGTHFYNWDTGTSSYKKVSAYDNPTKAVGIDTNNNIYIQYADSSVEMVSNVMPAILYADFDAESYNYTGVDIQANIVAYVKNFLGKYLTSSVTLNLYGNVKFTDTGTKSKTVTTSNLDKLNIPITIYDTGNLRVSIKVN